MMIGEDDKYHMRLKPQPARIKVFGERHTGTRAVIRMLYNYECAQQNFSHQAAGGRVRKRWKKGFNKELYKDAIEDIRRRSQGGVSAWKHAAPMIDGSYAAQKRVVLFLVRDPYSWVLSFHRKPYHARRPAPSALADFLQQPWPTVQRDNVAPVLASPLGLWNEKLRAYRAFIEAAPVPVAVLRFEDFVQHPVAALGAAMQAVGVSPSGLKALDKPTKSWGMSEKERKAYYSAERWRAEISPAAAALIGAQVDWDIAAGFGYEKRDPEDF